MAIVSPTLGDDLNSIFIKWCAGKLSRSNQNIILVFTLLDFGSKNSCPNKEQVVISLVPNIDLLSVTTRTFVNDHNAVLVCHLVDFLSVRIVRGPERVGAHPFDEVEVFHPKHGIPAFASQLLTFVKVILQNETFKLIKKLWDINLGISNISYLLNYTKTNSLYILDSELNLKKVV